jgi:glutamyl-tRNA synthetase
MIKTRLAPSPTGFMHIGTARTALFNWLYAKHTDGKFCLRIEDTDRSPDRYFPEAVDIIYNELKWLGLEWDELVKSQYERSPRHIEVANELLKNGSAYYCYLTQQELETLREEARKTGKPIQSPYRDGTKPAPEGVKPVIRLKMPNDGTSILNDIVQGEIKVENNTIEDLILVRSDGSPTYNLSVVVDDHDMGITYVIRGADHINNTFKQMQIIKAMGWDLPTYAHVPLILGPDGSKMSKRHGATTTEDYRKGGYLPKALFNYLLKLGWSHGDDEIISIEDAITWFDAHDILKSPAKFDHTKLTALNALYIRNTSNEELLEMLIPFMEEKVSHSLSATEKDLLLKGIADMKERSKTLVEMANMGIIYIVDEKSNFKPEFDEKSLKVLNSDKNKIPEIINDFENQDIEWSKDGINNYFKQKAESFNMKMGDIVAPVRVAVTFSTVSPPLFEAMVIIGKEETLRRLKNI